MTQPFQNRDYWERRLGAHFGPEGVGYLKLGRRFNEWMYRIRARVFDRAVARLPIDWPTARVLDVGAGTGFYIDRWLTRGVPAPSGADLTQVVEDRLSARYPASKFVQADIGAPLPSGFPISPASLDAVSAFDVLFHIVDDAQYRMAFVNIASLLKPRGWFLWSDNFLHHATERVVHQASRPLAESEALVRDAGFEIVSRVPMFVLMNYPADTTSRLARYAWTGLVAPAALSEVAGWCLGALLYPLERVLLAIRTESPSTEMMICRKL